VEYNLTRPCAKCPFRHDIRGYLRSSRAREIAEQDGEFPCHETTEHDEEGEYVDTGEEKACAGFLIFREKMDQPNQMMRITERLGMYDRTKLDMDAPVFDEVEAMVEHHGEWERGKQRRLKKTRSK
jgi:hypothetical protein